MTATRAILYQEKGKDQWVIAYNSHVLTDTLAALTAQPTPNFHGYTLVGFDTESIMTADMKNFQFAVPMPANSTASSYLCYIQLTFPNGTMFVFQTFAATPEDWTELFSLVDSEHTILVSFDGADDWVGIYALLSTQFRTDRQKENKDPVVKAIYFNAYRPHRSYNWTFSRTPPLTPVTHFYCFWLSAVTASFPKYTTPPALFPHDSLDATEIDHLANALIAAFYNVALSDILPTDLADRIYPTILQIALPVIMRDQVLSAYKFFMLDCTSSDHGQSFFRNGAQQFSKRQSIDAYNTPEAPHHPEKDKDLALQPRSMFDDPKRLQAAISSAMKNGLTNRLIEFLNFPVWPIYELAIRDRIQFDPNLALPPIPHQVDHLWIECIAPDQPLCD
uniref:Uncharacterized protein n=1 Tax=Romanomermis culicivorax TaxID=13658 RepID=A0A915IJX9_ROMCU